MADETSEHTRKCNQGATEIFRVLDTIRDYLSLTTTPSCCKVKNRLLIVSRESLHGLFVAQIDDGKPSLPAEFFAKK